MKRRFVVPAAVLLSAIAAQASIITENVNVTPTSNGAGGTLVFSFAQFDPTLGTLNSVNLMLTPTIGDIGSSIYNLGGTVQLVASASVSNPAGSLSGLGLDALWSSIQSFNVQNYSANPGVDNVSLPFSSFVTTPSSVTVGSAGFVGTGTYTLDLSGTSTATSSGSPGYPLFYGWYGDIGGDLEVQYDYTANVPVPEPTTMVAGALLLLPFGVSALRICAKSKQRSYNAGRNRA